MQLLQLIYVSRPLGFDETALNSILLAARHYNRLNKISGALVCRDDLYLQLLEGPDAAVRKTYDHILQDNRHIEITLISEVKVDDRMFPGWDMKDDPVQSWMWSRDEVHRGAAKNATHDEAVAIFKWISVESISLSDV